MECYSVIKKNEILPFAIMWMQLECIMLSKISQSQKDKYYIISFIYGILDTKQMNMGKGSKYKVKTERETNHK